MVDYSLQSFVCVCVCVCVLGVCLLVYVKVLLTLSGHAVAQLVEALRYKPEGHQFDSRLSYLSLT